MRVSKPVAVMVILLLAAAMAMSVRHEVAKKVAHQPRIDAAAFQSKPDIDNP